MAASLIEQILARAAAALVGSATTVARGRQDAFAPEEHPVLNLCRGNSPAKIAGERSDDITVSWEVHCHVRGADWETTADALHMAAHAVLMQDATLATLGHRLRCIETDAQADAAEQTAGKLIARYQMQIRVRPDNLGQTL